MLLIAHLDEGVEKLSSWVARWTRQTLAAVLSVALRGCRLGHLGGDLGLVGHDLRAVRIVSEQILGGGHCLIFNLKFDRFLPLRCLIQKYTCKLVLTTEAIPIECRLRMLYYLTSGRQGDHIDLGGHRRDSLALKRFGNFRNCLLLRLLLDRWVEEVVG